MQPGRKKDPAASRLGRGTLPAGEARALRNARRDGVDTKETAAVAPALSVTPPELPLEVADVWAEYVNVAVANGARQCDADSFAEWCSMAAILRKARNATVEDEEGRAVASPAPAPASYVAQFRMLGELFGLAGPGSRVARPLSAEPEKKSNPFARNGRR